MWSLPLCSYPRASFLSINAPHFRRFRAPSAVFVQIPPNPITFRNWRRAPASMRVREPVCSPVSTFFLIQFTCGLDIGEFSFFVSDVSGRLTDIKATRRGVLALRNFEHGEKMMSVSFDSMFSIEQIHHSKISHLVPVFEEIGMNDMAILIVTLM